MAGDPGAASGHALDVLVHVQDPGAVNCLLHLPVALRRRGRHAVIFAQGAATEILTREGVPWRSVPEGSLAIGLIEKAAPRLVLVGTAEDPDCLGLHLVDAARDLGIPSIGVVDAFSNADFRFRGRSADALAHAPDWLIVADAATAETYADLGFRQDAIAVCGHPHYDHVRMEASQLEREGVAALRRRLLPEAPEGRTVLVFIAEISAGLGPARFRRSEDYTLSGFGGGDGRTDVVLEEFLAAVERLDPRPHLVLRLHPKNTRDELAPYLDRFDGISEGGSPLELVFAADGVVGMTSMLLVEAALLGRPTLSIVPRRSEQEWLPTTRSGITPVASTRQEVEERVRELASGRLRPPSRELLHRVLPEGSVQRTVSFLEERLETPVAAPGSAGVTFPRHEGLP